MLSRVFNRIYHYTVYAIGILVLTAAVLVTLVRLFLPDIGIYRGEVEAWVSSYMGYPVVIHSLDAAWEGWVPHLQLSDIDLLNKAGTQPITHFDSAQILIAPLATLLKRRIMPKQLTISGFKLAIARLSNGAIYIEGINVSDPQISQLGDNELAEWLFKQEQIKIENGTIEWLDVKHRQQPVLLTDVKLTLRSDGNRLQADGSADLPELYGKKLDFSFDANGDLLSSQWSGELYLAGHDINPDHWYRDYRPLNFNISGGSADIKTWSTWQKAKLASLQGELQYKNFETRAGDSRLHVHDLAYHFLGERVDENGWQFHLNLDHLLTDNGDWPETKIIISATRATDSKDYRYSSSFNYLKLDDLSPFISQLTFLPETVKDKLTNLSIHGELSQGKLIYDPENVPDQRLRFDTRFVQVDTDFGAQLPSLSNLSGHLYGYLNQGVISLDSNNTQLEFNLLGEKPLQLKQLSGKVIWHKTEDGWQLGTDVLHLQNADLSATISGDISKLNNHDSPFVSVAVALDEGDLEKIHAYLPRTSRFKLRDWMKRSVLGGRLNSASAVFRGYISDFPFDNHNGRFKLIADASNATLDYSALWPPVDNIDAEIIIDGREMRAGFRHGEIFGASISDAGATMADILIKHKTVALDGHIRGSTKDLSLFINQSPLQKDPGLNEISHSLQGGDFSMDLDMQIPIKQPGKTAEVAGNVTLSNSVLKSSIENLQLDKVEGNIAFTRESVNSEPLNASFSGNPVTLLISGSKLDPKNLASISVTGVAEEEFVTDRLMEYFPALESLEYYFRERMLGKTEWSLTLTNVPGEKEGTVVKRLEVESKLNGMEIDLPAPIGKPENSSVPIKISSYLGTEQPRNIQIEYGDILDAELLLDANKKLNAINIYCGEDQPRYGNETGLHISGAVHELVAADWWEVIKPRNEDKDRTPSAVIEAGVSVDLQVSSLDLLHFRFADVSLSILRPEQYWNFKLQSDDINGEIQIPADRKYDNLISFQMDRLVLNRDQQQSGRTNEDQLHPRNIAAIQGGVNEFIYNDINLGEMHLQISPVTDGLLIEQLSFEKPSLSISGSGEWTSTVAGDTSSFDLQLHADDMESMLTTFGYDESPVKKGETELQLKAVWQGSPMDFALEKVNGTLDMQVSKGQLLDINPSVGRLFGLFSLQTLSRRLTLDFSDIFGKGLAFDRIEGSFDIDGGNAYTNDLFMRGPSANIAVSGRTGLSDQDYDQIVTVTPQFSDNLPVAGALLGPVGIGLGAIYYLAGQLFNSVHDSVDKLLRYQYTITGSWHEPVIEKIKKHKTRNRAEASG